MTAPDNEFQEMVRLRIINDPSVPLSNVYSYGQTQQAFPYARFGNSSLEPDDEECRDVSVVQLSIHVFGRAGWTEVRNIAGTIKKSLHDYDGIMVQNALRQVRILSIEYQDDPDGITVHAVINVEGEIEDL